MLLMIDNYDSFTYNLVQYLGELGENLKVFRNDKITLKKIKALRPERIVISPGPGTPTEAGISKELIREFAAKVPVLGVCLGHQCIGEVYGGKVIPAKTKAAEALRSEAITGAPDNDFLPSIIAWGPSRIIFAPIRLSSATCINRSG